PRGLEENGRGLRRRDKGRVMPRAGLEPATSRSSVSHSPKLSYRGSRGPSVNERNSFCARESTERVSREEEAYPFAVVLLRDERRRAAGGATGVARQVPQGIGLRAEAPPPTLRERDRRRRRRMRRDGPADDGRDRL